jgi:vitellogenic carboxypeptidase-like protein
MRRRAVLMQQQLLLLAALVALVAAVASPAAARPTMVASAASAASAASPVADDGANALTTTTKPTRIALPSPTHAGYLDLGNNRGEMYYMYYEAEEPEDATAETTPVLLWLQGGPGCSSLFGAFYINGPYLINADLTLRPNPGRWNRKYGTLFIDQPVGVGFSVARRPEDVPSRELPLAADLYLALNAFYAARGPAFARRPLFVTGESYAGKYVPSIAHYILQAHARAHGYEHELRHPRRLGPGAARAPPRFPYGGCAIGNGFTGAVAQTLVQAEVAHNMGLIDWDQRERAEALQRRVAEAASARDYVKARRLSDEVLAVISGASGLGTLEDVRREKGYDAEDRVGTLLNLPRVQKAVGVRDVEFQEEEEEDGQQQIGGEGDADNGADNGANNGAATFSPRFGRPQKRQRRQQKDNDEPPPPQPPQRRYESCSPVVDSVMGADVMRSTAHLVPDLLAHGHVMLYHGQFDAECGARSNEAWLEALRWPGAEGFKTANRTLWWGGVEQELARKKREGGTPPPPLPNAHSGFYKTHMRLAHYIVRNAGHMVPHDRPEVGQALIEEWVDGVLMEQGRAGEGEGGGAFTPRVWPGRRPPPLEGAWAGWGRQAGEAPAEHDPYDDFDQEPGLAAGAAVV